MPYPFTEIESMQLGVIHRGNTPYYVQYKAITASASGATTIVAAPTVAGQQIVVLDITVTHSANVNWNLQSHTTTSVATGLMYGTAGPPVVLSDPSNGLFAAVPGEALDINLSASTAVGGTLTYIVLPPP